MPADSGREGFAELLARARVAVLALAPEDSRDSPPEATARALAVMAALLAELETRDDTLRALLAVDMALAIDDAPSATGGGRDRLAALLGQALSVLAEDGPEDGGAAALPSRSPLALANELRALRGAPLLSGNVVFAVAAGARAAAGDDSGNVDPRLAASARRLRSYYQQGLIAWLGGDAHATAAAHRLGEVFARLQALSQGTAGEFLWRVAVAFAKLLEDPRWRVSAAVKRLLGQLDAQLKHLGERHAPAPQAAPALVQDLLFYVGEGHDGDATVGVFATRAALQAAFAVPPRAHTDQPTAVLSLLNELLGVSGQLMEALAADESWLVKRSWLSERMLQVADGLGLLGAPELRRRALEEIALLRSTPGSGDPPAGGWGQVAERLHALAADLLTAAGMKPAAAVAEDTAGMPSSGHIARRLEADLVHAEGVIQRLEQGQASLPAEPPAAPSGDAEDRGAVMLRHRLDAFTGELRSQHHHLVSDQEASDEAVDASPLSLSEDLPAAAVDQELLDDIARLAGDIDGSRSRLEQQVGAFREGLQDMHAGIRTLRQALDGLRVHTGALRMPHDPADPGEMPPDVGHAPPLGDIFQHLDRLAESISALSDLRDSIETSVADSRSLLVQQARDHVALEQRLNHTRMQPLDTQLENLRAELAERAAGAGKQVLLRVDAGELRIEPEKMAALLPVLRSLTASMIGAGVEPPRARVLAGLAPGCLMEMRFKRRGADLDMLLTADCKAPAEVAVSEAQAFLRPLGGRLELQATGRSETRCKLQMPLAPRVSTVLLVAVGGEILALPLGEVTAVLQLSAEELEAGEEAGIEHGNQRWQLGRLSALLALGGESRRDTASRQPLVLAAADGGRHALVVDAIGERVDVVVRSVVPQLRSVRGLAGAAILGDGQVVLLLDVGQLVESRCERPAADLESVS
ncbi:MAG: hypothetical protein BMS9Abin14_137 [Gammaproteobacteria bacterium]|nr:MAG: hypothetical protein BMS9Abin14_137 [Gammaproteobacteria bacterium]